MDHSILIIEDDDALIGILGRWLRDAGFPAPRSVGDGETAKLALAEQPWDLIISDVCLPDMDGIEIARTIREQSIPSRILLMTGHLSTEVTLRALDQRVDGFLPKPMERDQFLGKVTELLSQPIAKSARRKRQRVLAIGAHPDDVEIGCGGILLGHRNQGDALCILTLSTGECGGTSGVRGDESRAAAERLSAELILANLKDARISEGPDTISVLSRGIDMFDPTVIYTHSLHDAHQDHRNTHRATMVAARGVPSVYTYQSPSTTIGFTPNRFVDIASHLAEKLKLISCFQSQRSIRPYLSDSMISSTAEYWGRFANYGQVEPLETVRSA